MFEPLSPFFFAQAVPPLPSRKPSAVRKQNARNGLQKAKAWPPPFQNMIEILLHFQRCSCAPCPATGHNQSTNSPATNTTPNRAPAQSISLRFPNAPTAPALNRRFDKAAVRISRHAVSPSTDCPLAICVI